jgi:murein DD-endopeptidase MepM/ murein hydrolase activator NlpD
MPAGLKAGTGAKRLQLRLTLDTKRKSRTLVLPPFALFFLFALIPLAGVIYLGATCYFVFHDDLLARLTEHQIAMQYNYEDRLARLRHEITNLTQHAKVNETELGERLSALMARQDLLESRTTFVASLAERAKTLRDAAGAGAAQAATHPDADAPNPLPGAGAEFDASGGAAPPSASQNDATMKPQPEDFDLRLTDQPRLQPKPAPAGNGNGGNTSFLSPSDFDYGLPLTTRIDRLALRQDNLDAKQLSILNSLQQPAQRVASRLRAAFDAAGLSSDQFAPKAANAKALDTAQDMGGPFVPLPTGTADDAAFARAATDAQDAIASAERLRLIATYVPFASPLLGQVEVTSPFGPRIDPFFGRPALHTGIDLREDYGAPVRATAMGTVTFAGADGGYGNLVEVDHGNGLSTRYAHLSSITVREGQKVSEGTVLGHIGETGRATGPHLHYETRINGQPVDPARFLRAGMRLHLFAADTAL